DSLKTDVVSAAKRLAVTEQRATELLDGERDVFVAACKDFYNSPYGSPGKACPVAVWTCLSCPLAVFTPSKVPNLLRLKDHLDRQWDALSVAEWTAVYGAASVRLERDILPMFSTTVITAARAALETDEVPLYLRPEDR